MDAGPIDLDLDERTLGTVAPAGRGHARARPLHVLAGGLIGLGALTWLLVLSGVLPAGSWWVLGLALGVPSAGGSWLFWLRYRGRTAGIHHDDTTFRSSQARGVLGWLLAVAFVGFYTLLYWWPERLGRAVDVVEPLSRWMRHSPADPWFLYGALYTLAVGVFGLRMLLRYRHDRYQRLRTSSVMLFQGVLAFVLPGVLKALHQPEFYFTYFWPLKYGYGWPGARGMGSLWSDPGGLGAWFVLWGAAAILVVTPLLTYLVGKRWYCSWVCGCGGLAETLGDPWRQLSSKATWAWMLERVLIHIVLLWVVVVTVLLWIAHLGGGVAPASVTASLARWYGFFIGALFSGVIGVGFYPLLGSRVWCRFGCPMAALLGIQQRLLSRFRITTNGGQCMSCGNCSAYCEMGIDVRGYAQAGANIVRASCVGCGVCAAVCPRGVLKLENGPLKGRFVGSDRPLRAVMDSLLDPRIP
ncbi:MAG: 4Fe-4S dicluster domain-containing protein [Pseudomonadota bacterium]